jgi:hypothetical protein
MFVCDPLQLLDFRSLRNRIRQAFAKSKTVHKAAAALNRNGWATLLKRNWSR